MPLSRFRPNAPRRSNFRRLKFVSLLTGLLLALLVLQPGSTVRAFKPNNPVVAGDKTHSEMTRAAIEDILRNDLSRPQITPSMHSAIKEIAKSNAATDVKDAFFAEYHFDDENFAASQNLLTRQIRRIKASMTADNVENARRGLGEALHTMQDFYSHSNWVEMGNLQPNPTIGIPGATIQNTAGNAATCIRYAAAVAMCV